MNNSPYLSAGEVASLLGKSLKWTYQNKNQIPGFFMIGKSVFWEREVLLSTLRDRALKKPTPQKEIADKVKDRHRLKS